MGDLVLFGPRPVEVLERLDELPAVSYVRGNTDRYVLTGDQPAPHRTAEAAGSVDLVARYVAMAAAIGWTRGALVQAGVIDVLSELAPSIELALPDGRLLQGVHAGPRRDEGPGIDNSSSEDQLLELISMSSASVIVGGHTHDPTNRAVGGVRVLNPGSVGLPRGVGEARWLMIDTTGEGLTVDLRRASFDVQAVVRDLHLRRHPSASFVGALLTGRQDFRP